MAEPKLPVATYQLDAMVASSGGKLHQAAVAIFLVAATYVVMAVLGDGGDKRSWEPCWLVAMDVVVERC